MKVFISWSGEKSKAVAEALRYWLPKVIQALEPWMSADDIEKGTRWRSGIATELEQSSVGIICLTRENLDSTWIHFEAGALSKQQQNTYVCTLLFDLEPTDIREPLAQFQATKAEKSDLRKLVSTINNTLADVKLPESELAESFDIWWTKLESLLGAIAPPTRASQKAIRKDREILDEILGLIRAQARQTNLESDLLSVGGRIEVAGRNLPLKGKRLLSQVTGLSRESIDAGLFGHEYLFKIFMDATGSPSTARRLLMAASQKYTDEITGNEVVSSDLLARDQENPNENSNP